MCTVGITGEDSAEGGGRVSMLSSAVGFCVLMLKSFSFAVVLVCFPLVLCKCVDLCLY